MQESVCEQVRQLESQYTGGYPVVLGKYVTWDMYDTIEKILSYINSKHISGPTDSLGREKPFFNIVTAATNVWYRATDLDRKNILIRASNQEETIPAFLANILVHEWMRENNFGVFLNNWGRTLAQYGSCVAKFVEKNGELYSEVIPWSRLICDPVDFDNNLKIEKLFFTPSQLRKKEGYDKDMVEELIEKAQTIRKTLDRRNVDTRADYIEVYEVHGELPLSLLTERESDNEEYVQQMHVVSFVATDKKNANGTTAYDDYTLAKGKESKDPYFISHLIKEEGRTLAIGAVEYLFDAQWMANHTAKLIKDQLDLASKLIFQTSDTAFANYNALEAIETGDILVNNGNPLTQLQNNSHDITSIQNYQTQWVSLSKELTSSTDAARGNTQPSGTAYRLQALITQQSLSLFELMTENKGLAIEDMMKKYVIPFVMKKLNTTDEISTMLEEHQIKKIDSMYLPNEVNRRVKQRIKETVLNGGVVSPYQKDMMVQAETQDIKNQLSQMGSQRFIKPSDVPTETWKELFKDFEWKCEVEVTDEQRDKAAILETLNTLLQTVAGNPAILQDPRGKLLFNKIVSETGMVSPIELDIESTNQPQLPTPTSIPNPIPTNQPTGGV